MQLFSECTVAEAKLLDLLLFSCKALHSLVVEEIKADLYQCHKVMLYITIT